ncbi:MAG: DMT family transporter [Nitrososphaerota archaeon]|nr:DMT family transporter [Candidatus Calditenuis fumarioli]
MKVNVHLLEGALAGTFFGTSAVFIRLMPELSATSISLYRLGLSALFLTLGHLLLRRDVPSPSRVGWPKLVAMGALLGLHVLLFTTAVKLTSVLNAAVLVNTTPIWALALSYVLWRHVPDGTAMIGTVLAVSGVVVISGSQLAFSPGNLLGDAVALLSALTWAVYLIVARPVRRTGSPLSLLPFVYGAAALTIAASSPATGELIRLPNSAELAPLLGQALLPTTLGHTLQFSSLKGLTPHQAATLALLEPVVAPTLAALFLNEVPRPELVAGAALVITGIYFVASRAGAGST